MLAVAPLSIAALIPAVVLLIYGFFNPLVGGSAFAIVSVLVVLWVRLTEWSGRRRVARLNLTSAEIEVVREYYVALRWPATGKIISLTVQAVRAMILFAWIPWLIYQRLWILVGVFALYLVYTGPLTRRTDPFFHLPQAIGKDGLENYERQYECLLKLNEHFGPGWLSRAFGETAGDS